MAQKRLKITDLSFLYGKSILQYVLGIGEGRVVVASVIYAKLWVHHYDSYLINSALSLGLTGDLAKH